MIKSLLPGAKMLGFFVASLLCCYVSMHTASHILAADQKDMMLELFLCTQVLTKGMLNKYNDYSSAANY